jgi:hypothetical protein
MSVDISTHADEEGTFVITAAYTDENGDPVTPNNMKWTLTDESGTVINSRSAIVISPLGTSSTIVLSGDDLALQVGETTIAARLITFVGEYDSDLGSSLPLVGERRFYIDGIENIPVVTP